MEGNNVYIGLDNGVTATIGIVGDRIEPLTEKLPVRKEQDYTKAKNMITRVDVLALAEILGMYREYDVTVVMERPMVNPTRFKATTSALRCFEAELVIVESMKYRHVFLDSKEWQKVMLPKGCSGDELKKASLDIGNRLFPQFSEMKHPDRDGLLIAEYARRNKL